MDNVVRPHDKFCKETLGNVSIARDFIFHYLPNDILGIIDIKTLLPLKDGFITQDLKEYFSDLLFSVNMDGKESYLYFLFEHKSYLEKNILLQLLTYMVRIWENKLEKEKAGGLPIIVPLVIYHGRPKWNIGRNLADIVIDYPNVSSSIQKHVPDFEYLLYDFSEKGAEELKGEKELRIFLQILRYIFTTDIEQVIIVIEKASDDLEANQLSYSFFNTLITYILNTREDLPVDEVSSYGCGPNHCRYRFIRRNNKGT
jgi:predicted transposase/invertase (TIGR01784 family)